MSNYRMEIDIDKSKLKLMRILGREDPMPICIMRN